MKTPAVFLTVLLASLTACNKSDAPATSSGVSSKPPDVLQLKLQDYAGTSASNCGRLDVHATQLELKTASDCVQLGNQKKQPFFVAYDMPGMAVGVAGNAEGKLFTVQAQGNGPSAAITGGDCPSQLRVATSGRVTCFAPGDMGSMSGSHGSGAVPPGMANPHGNAVARPGEGKQ